MRLVPRRTLITAAAWSLDRWLALKHIILRRALLSKNTAYVLWRSMRFKRMHPKPGFSGRDASRTRV